MEKQKSGTRYFRHNDPRCGFKLCEQLQIANSEKLLFSAEIQKVNSMYKQCADRQAESIMKQPPQNQVLQKLSLLLLLPLLLSLALDDYEYLVVEYVLSVMVAGYYVWEYFSEQDHCKDAFFEAGQKLKHEFFGLQREFEGRWPGYGLVLVREWSETDEISIEYIEICRKDGHQSQRSPQLQSMEQKQPIQYEPTGQSNIVLKNSDRENMIPNQCYH